MVGDRGSVGVEPDRVETRATVSHVQHGDAACRSFEGERQQKINTNKQKVKACHRRPRWGRRMAAV